MESLWESALLVWMVGWLAGRKQFRLGGGRELPLLESKKKIPEQVVKRATALTLQLRLKNNI